MTTIVWLANDLRISDNPALFHAAASGRVVPVFIWSPEEEGPWEPGGAHRWWLHHSLTALRTDLQSMGSGLVIRRGPTDDTLCSLAHEAGASRVAWNTRLEPALRRRDDVIARRLTGEGLEVIRYQSAILHDPDTVRTDRGDPYRVFTPFWKRFVRTVDVAFELPIPDLRTASPATWPGGLSADDLLLLPEIDWAGGLRGSWIPGESSAQRALQLFIDEKANAYADERHSPTANGTSRLSPHLRFGEVSPRQIWNQARGASSRDTLTNAFLRQIGWREFSYHLLYHFPETTDEPLDPRYAQLSWTGSKNSLREWQQGRTGYPFVDAAMRQLWNTGWMHNRTRMVVASFLTRHLLVDWREGARWFWDTLVDADLANNTQGWQWAAGCGADAQPFFRMFNPVTQGRQHDPEGRYVRRWLPEISGLPDRFIHAPWEAPLADLNEAGVVLGDHYPSPVVDHAVARRRAMRAFEAVF